MAKHRRPNPRFVKIHRSYLVDEAAQKTHVHKNTVRNWIKQGLVTVDCNRPTLILGRDLREFLSRRREKARRPCSPGQIYCVKCRVPKSPAGQMADYLPITSQGGNLAGICPDCGKMIYRRVSLGQLETVRGDLEIVFREAPAHIVGTDEPSDNCDLKVAEVVDENS